MHEKFLKIAMNLAEKGRGSVSPNPVVGAVLVRAGKIIAKDWHRKYGYGHAERNLLKKFKGKVKATDTLYITLEPCCHHGQTGPCTSAILEGGVKKVVVGILDPNPEVGGKGVRLLRDKGVKVEVLEEGYSKFLHINSKIQELQELLWWQNRFFFRWVKDRRPWITLKVAQTLDGRIVPERGKPLRLTGEKAKEHVYKMRELYDALLVGVGTVIADNPTLKLKNGVVIILDAALSIPMKSTVIRPGTIIFRGKQFKKRLSKKKALIREGVEVVEVDTNADGYLALHQVLAELAARGISSVYVEGGPAVWSSFLRESLVDDLMVYIAPKFLGAGVESFEDLGFKKGLELFPRELKQFGEDIFLWQTICVI